MIELGIVQERFRTNPTRRTLGDYYEVTIQQWRKARYTFLYYTKCSLDNCLMEIGFAAERMGISLIEIATERDLRKEQAK